MAMSRVGSVTFWLASTLTAQVLPVRAGGLHRLAPEGQAGVAPGARQRGRARALLLQEDGQLGRVRDRRRSVRQGGHALGHPLLRCAPPAAHLPGVFVSRIQACVGVLATLLRWSLTWRRRNHSK